MGQARANRHKNVLTPEHKRGGYFRAGISTRATTVVRRPRATPGSKGPSPSVKPRLNKICKKKIPTIAVREEQAALKMDREARNRMLAVSALHSRMVGQRGVSAEQYDAARVEWLKLDGGRADLVAELKRLELCHWSCSVVGQAGRQQKPNPRQAHIAQVGRVLPKVAALNAERQSKPWNSRQVWTRGV